MDDIEVTATWGSEINTPVEVIWKDGNNADGLRPEKLRLSYMNNGSTETSSTIVSSDLWKTTVSGETTSIAPDWELLGDEAIGYRYEVTGELGKGFTVTIYHAPQMTVTVAGIVDWDDVDDHYQKRPDNVTLHLYRNGGELDSTEVTAAGGWAYSFGTFAQYEDYEEVVYTVIEDSIDYYQITGEGFNFVNVYKKPVNYDIVAEVTWKDSGDVNGSVYLRGDANRDGAVNVKDVTAIQRFLSQMPPGTFNEKAADVDGSGIDISDATNIQRRLAEFDDPYNVNELVIIEADPAQSEYESSFVPK